MSKISDLSDGGVIQGGDTLIAVRSGGNVKVTYGGSTTANIDGGTIDGTVIGGTTAAAGSFTTGSFTGNVSFGDNDKAIFGTGSDLQIFHDGSNSFISDQGSGSLVLRGSTAINLQNGAGTEYLARFFENGSANLYYDAAQKLATTATGIDVTGTVSADGLTVDGDATVQTTSGNTSTFLLGQSGVRNWRFQNIATTGELQVKPTPTTTAFEIASNGDVSLFEDTGTTAKFFWDSSAERLGLGTSSPSSALEVAGSAVELSITDSRNGSFTAGDTVASLGFYSDDTSGSSGTTPTLARGAIDVVSENAFGSSHGMVFRTRGDITTAATEAMRISSAGQVGIGTDSPANTQGGLDAAGAILARGGVAANQTSAGGFDMSGNSLRIRSWGATAGSGVIDFRTGGGAGSVDSQAMRIDSSQNLLVGKSSYDSTLVGGQIGANGIGAFTATNTLAGVYNRLTSDGSIVDFRKDNSTVGTIGTRAGDLSIGTGDTGLNFWDASDKIIPENVSTGAARDDAISLGASGVRFKDGHFSGNINANTFTAIDGVYIGGTGFANKLDDYEEGTWTPELADAISGGNAATIASASGFYTKVGNIVHVTIRALNITTTGMTAGNDVVIRGLPFTQNGSVNFVGSVQLSEISFDGSLVIYGDAGTAVVKIAESASGSLIDFVTVGQLTSGGADIQACLTYQIS